MANIGGNIEGVIQVKTSSGKNEIGEAITNWSDKFTGVCGWLGLMSGDSKHSTYKAKLEESTHCFLCDYDSDIYALAGVDDVRMIIKGFVYDVLLIDNPDEMDEQLEIFLKRVGAWNG